MPHEHWQKPWSFELWGLGRVSGSEIGSDFGASLAAAEQQ